MARTLIKLDSGIIHTPEFADYLQGIHKNESSLHRHEVLALDYIRCASGEKKGSAWMQLAWIPEQSAPSIHRHTIGGVEVFIHRQSVRGLKHHCLHFDNGQVVVLS